MNIFIFAKTLKDEDYPYISSLFKELQDRGARIYIKDHIAEELDPRIKSEDFQTYSGYEDLMREKADFFITLGGDGTILEAVTIVRDSNVPVLGINLGRMGFLASIEKKLVSKAVDDIMMGRYNIEERTLLFMESNPPLFGDTTFALNDCTLTKRDTSSMVVVHTFINGDFLNSYWADGIIVATPTGSTGYSLSCGGPIIFPNSGNFVVTPVSPHNLNVRPIVISDNSVISFELEGRADHFLCTLDSRYETINRDHQIAVRKNDFYLRLVRLHDHSFLHTIRNKLTWGIDKRN